MKDCEKCKKYDHCPKYGFDAENCTEFVPNWHVLVEGTNEVTVEPGICRMSGGNEDENVSNACLFAAAPEMQNVLSHYFELLQMAEHGNPIAEAKLYEDMPIIEAALKKVRGEE